MRALAMNRQTKYGRRLGCLAAYGLIFIARIAVAQSMPTVAGYAALPDNWLLGKGQPWQFLAKASVTPSPIGERKPSANEGQVVERAKWLLANKAAKAILLADGNRIVYAGYKPPAGKASRFWSASIGKSVTSLAIGKAICGRRMRLTQRADEFIEQLRDKPLGRATVRDLLRMASGSTTAFSDSTITTKEQNEGLSSGKLSWLDVVSDSRVSAQRKGIFSDFAPGEVMDYKTTDPVTLGIAFNFATGMTFSEWIDKSVLSEAAIAADATLGRDKAGYSDAASGVRMTMEDWLRFAYWVQQSSKKNDCFGDYVRQATTTQIRNTEKRFGKLFNGYGYFFWTENVYARNSYWALGYGGQRIGWSEKNDRIVIVFSNVEDWMPELYELAAQWFAAE
jgi:CubicO group peptidase (beta-lactamase class C family)